VVAARSTVLRRTGFSAGKKKKKKKKKKLYASLLEEVPRRVKMR
jgi:hypothetical protein